MNEIILLFIFEHDLSLVLDDTYSIILYPPSVPWHNLKNDCYRSYTPSSALNLF
jgi:hypothetical protein